mmetsp:Transcript_25159/g.53569  ORF Transcript_25159/g.53569 Transcript_25159/m.53569 type:complete len:115 (+) Transcript_25159:55-399(+)
MNVTSMLSNNVRYHHAVPPASPNTGIFSCLLEIVIGTQRRHEVVAGLIFSRPLCYVMERDAIVENILSKRVLPTRLPLDGPPEPWMPALLLTPGINLDAPRMMISCSSLRRIIC